MIQIAQRTLLRPDSEVLEIGTATGFTAIELCRATRARVTAIDLNAGSLLEASRRAEKLGLASKISFERQDATNLPYEEGAFDVVLCGNVTSLVSNRERALQEYIRVLKPDGYLVAMPMYYLRHPPDDLVRNVGRAIGVDLRVQFQSEWASFFCKPPLCLVDSQDFAFDEIAESAVDAFVDDILKRPHLAPVSFDAMQALKCRYSNMMMLFRQNLSYMGFSILYLRQDVDIPDVELFTSHRL